MLLLFTKLRGHRLHATDGGIGSVTDVYFDDATWDVRYLVVDVGTWLVGRKVLLVPKVLGSPLGEKESILVNLSKEQIRHSPDIDTDNPVSRQHEAALYSHYGWSTYWGEDALMSTGQTAGFSPGVVSAGIPHETSVTGKIEVEVPGQERDPHLRSAGELDGYHIHAEDGEIGSVADLVVDEAEWRVRYLVVKPGGWFSGDRVLIPPAWIRKISWEESSVHVDVNRKTIADSPPYDSSRPLTREYEERLYRHYSRTRYWT